MGVIQKAWQWAGDRRISLRGLLPVDGGVEAFSAVRYRLVAKTCG